MASFRPRNWVALPRLAGVAFVVLFANCSPTPRPSVELSIYFSCDTHGRLVPCGCFTGQYGGLTRLRTFLNRHSSPDSLRVDVGDAIGGNEDYDLIQYRYLLRAYETMRFDALNIGQAEARCSAAQLHGFAEDSKIPLISANLLDQQTGRLILPAYKIVTRHGWRIGIVGVVDPRGLTDNIGAGLAVEKMELALSKLLPTIRPQVDVIVLLAFTDEATLARLAAEFYELDVILGGKVSQPSQKLEKHNRSLVLFVTNESRAVGHLRVRLDGKPLTALGHDIHLLAPDVPEDPGIEQLAADYRAEVRNATLAIDSPEHLTAAMVPGVRVSASFVGSESCLPCHPSAAAAWRKSSHAHAFSTLTSRQADMDPKCIGCHTVGFGQPSGYRRGDMGSKLADVGCESCHGPGSLHVQQHRDQAPVQFKFRPLGAGDCQKCHYGEFSRPFDWDTFWPRIKHGRESRSNP